MLALLLIGVFDWGGISFTVPPKLNNDGIYAGNGLRPATLPPRRSGREFDGGPDFGNGSWAQEDEDGVWRRYGG